MHTYNPVANDSAFRQEKTCSWRWSKQLRLIYLKGLWKEELSNTLSRLRAHPFFMTANDSDALLNTTVHNPPDPFFDISNFPVVRLCVYIVGYDFRANTIIECRIYLALQSFPFSFFFLKHMKSKSVLVKSEREITSGKQGIPRSRNLISGLRSLKLVWAVQAYALAPSQRLNCLMQLAQPMSQASGISPGCTLPLTKGLRSDSAKDTMNPFLTRPQSPRTAGRLKINSSIRIILLHCTSVFLVLMIFPSKLFLINVSMLFIYIWQRLNVSRFYLHLIWPVLHLVQYAILMKKKKKWMPSQNGSSANVKHSRVLMLLLALISQWADLINKRCCCGSPLLPELTARGIRVERWALGNTKEMWRLTSVMLIRST